MCRSLESEFDSELGLVTGRRHGLYKGSRHALITGLGGRHSRHLFFAKRRIPRKLADGRERGGESQKVVSHPSSCAPTRGRKLKDSHQLFLRSSFRHSWQEKVEGSVGQ